MREVRAQRASWLGNLWDAYFHRRYTILFYTLFLTLVAAPVLSAFEFKGALIELFLAANLLAALIPVATVRIRRVLLVTIAVIWLARPVTAWLDHSVLSIMTLGLWTALALFAAAGALRFALGSESVDAEHLYAALSAYMLAGIFFGLFYWVVEQTEPGSFNAAADFTRMSGFYFSFVTLATLGYGDIVPRSDVMRGLAVVEGVGGQLFLAVMVARLVSLYVNAELKRKS